MILNVFIELLETMLTFMGFIIVFISAVRFFIQYIFHIFGSYNLNSLRLNFGNNIIFGLDFIVAADIAHSMIELTYYAIGRLAILVIIRILLSYFLIKELDHISSQ